MKKIILDTNFILTCVKQKIDFFEYLEMQGLKILIPKQVIRELESIVNSKKKLHFRENAKLALSLLERNFFSKIDLKIKNVDSGILKFAKSNKDLIVATLDRGIKSKVQNQKMVIRGKKKLEVI